MIDLKLVILFWMGGEEPEFSPLALSVRLGLVHSYCDTRVLLKKGAVKTTNILLKGESENLAIFFRPYSLWHKVDISIFQRQKYVNFCNFLLVK